MLIDAILEMERNAASALDTIKRDRDKLPARIAVETAHIRQVVFREMELKLRELEEEIKISTLAKVAAIQENCEKQLSECEASFAANFAANKEKIWTITP